MVIREQCAGCQPHGRRRRVYDLGRVADEGHIARHDVSLTPAGLARAGSASGDMREQRLIAVVLAGFDDDDVVHAHALEAPGDRKAAIAAADHDHPIVLSRLLRG